MSAMEPSSKSLTKTLQQKIKAFRIFAQNRKMAHNNERRALSFNFISSRGSVPRRESPNDTIYGIRLDDCGDAYLFAREDVPNLGNRNHVRIQLNQSPASNEFCISENGRVIVVRVGGGGSDRELFLTVPLPQGQRRPDTSLFTAGEFANLFRELNEPVLLKALLRSRTYQEDGTGKPFDFPRTPSPPGTPKKTLPRMHQCPSVESFLKLGDPIHVQFVVLPGQKLFAVNARVDRTIAEIKRDISPMCRVPPEYIDLRKNRNLVMDYKTLKELGGSSKKKLRFTIELSKRCPPEYTLQIPKEDIIEQHPSVTKKLTVVTKSGWKTLKLTTEFPSEAKPFLGGYRDKRCNVIYHNASTQSPFVAQDYSEAAVHFSCQTFHDSTKGIQTLKDQYQQTERRDYYISELNQRIIYAKEYMSTEFIEEKRVKAAIIIQKYWRRWLAIRERHARLNGFIHRVEWAELIRKTRTETRLKVKMDELMRQRNPTRMVDIELLYRAINEWSQGEVAYIETHRWGADRKAAMAQIMEMEADLLLDLERIKSRIRTNLKDKLTENVLHKMGDPTRWLNRSGNFISMDTMTKMTVRQYHTLYHALREPVEDSESRIKLLDSLSQQIKGHTSILTQHLNKLIGREISLMQKFARERLLIGLRQRIANTFAHLLRDPSFNPEAKKLQKVPFDTMKLRKDMIQCKGCRQMQYRDQFTVVRGVTVTTRCITCMGLYRTCILRTDLNLYRRMLKELRHEEQSAGVQSSTTYLIDAYDLQFLIEQLWHGQSALSGIDDRYLLKLCRWLRNEPWTPWNCVLLTEEEAVAHLHLDSMATAYQTSFFQKVHVKHQAAKIYFTRLTSLALPLDPNLDDFCSAEHRKALKDQKAKKSMEQKKSSYKKLAMI